MKYFGDQKSYVIVLEKGEDLLDSLRDFARQAAITTAWIQGLGAALKLEIGYYDLDRREYVWKRLDGAHEITSLQGNVVRDAAGDAVFHIHGTFADTECRAYGGHVNRLVVGGTCEILVQPINANLTRKTDEATGLRLLCEGPVV